MNQNGTFGVSIRLVDFSSKLEETFDVGGNSVLGPGQIVELTDGSGLARFPLYNVHISNQIITGGNVLANEMNLKFDILAAVSIGQLKLNDVRGDFSIGNNRLLMIFGRSSTVDAGDGAAS